MNTFKKIENRINALKEVNQEAGNMLHDQLHRAANSDWSNQDLKDYLKSDRDAADLFFAYDEPEHAEIREIQDEIICTFAND